MVTKLAMPPPRAPPPERAEEEFDATPLETVDEFRRRNGGGNPPKPPQEDLAKMSPEDKALKKEVETKASGETVQERVYARNDTLLTT